MPRPSSEMLTDREAQIMEILWELQQATAEQVRERLPDNPHDSTVRTLLRVLKVKGQVRIPRTAARHLCADRSPETRSAQRGSAGDRSLLRRFCE